MDTAQVIGLVIVVAAHVATVTASHMKLAARIDAQPDKVKLAIVGHEKDCTNYDQNTAVKPAPDCQ